MPDFTPTTLLPILAHLLRWGEVTSAEARRLKAEGGLALMADAGLVQAVLDAWLIGPALKYLLPVDNVDEVWQKACWSLPAYQQYLTTLAAAEIARRGLEGAGDLVEEWIIALPHKAKLINELLDSLEQSDLAGAVIDSTPGALLQAVKHRLQEMEQTHRLDFAEWNRELLGVSAPDEAVFQAALRRGALAETQDPQAQPSVPFSPIQDLNAELAQPSGRWVLCPPLEHPNPLQHANLAADPSWCARRYGYSGVPLLHQTESSQPVAIEQVWEALSQHPLSWILIQLGLHAHIQSNSGAGEGLQLKIEQTSEGGLSDLCIELPDYGTRHLSETLTSLVSGLGMQLMLPFGKLEPSALGSWLDMLLQVGVLETTSESILLSPDFTRAAYESNHYQRLIKSAKPWRARLIGILKGE